MESRPLVLVLLQCVGGLVLQQHLHTWSEPPLSREVESSSAFSIPYVQTHQRLTQ